ncbi:MAG: cyclic pyranopterin monophosphate synthase MoaC [Acidobacteria bacterium]|nr:cyclic pyranopterin monophosphate synthase MoaC [Acidobacteriota bacterium]MCI0623067.1 cyclic pyranopterin monophosphate synthase MoaC [Acidobacteriota bacterium]MCI0721833.1 cyclic pyranopterin monophosphate synthase MoaC [Acidobacteriota bacterium]
MAQFSHLDDGGKIRMVDVTEKSVTVRTARARGLVKALPETLALIQSEKIAKGNPLEVARVAGIMAAKSAAQLIPLCHPLGLTHVDMHCRITGQGIELEATAIAEGKTGVEMEALTAVSVAALTIYDMCKAVDREMVITDVRLVEKTGGRSGRYVRKGEAT